MAETGGTLAEIATMTDTNYLVTGLQAGLTYDFAV